MPAEPFVPYTVSSRAALNAGAWADVADLICPVLTRGLAPTLDEASLLYQFGTLDGV
jgi:hypothetical protein